MAKLEGLGKMFISKLLNECKFLFIYIELNIKLPFILKV